MEKKINSFLKLKWALVCRSVSVDQKTGLLSVFNVIEEICLKSKSDLPSQLVIPVDINLVINLEVDDITSLDKLTPSLRVVILNPDKKEIGCKDIKIDLSGINNDKLRVIIGFDSFDIDDFGRYEFVICVKENDGSVYKKIGSTSIKIEKEAQK
ncbi:hypothetical protein M0R01_00745 [bacterium]|nr:hypothetical protein [bacterium]